MLLALALLTSVALGGCDNVDPGPSEEQPLIRWGDTPEQPSSSERGNVMINEIHFAGSVRDDGTHDPDDIFIELLNKQPRMTNVSGWRLNIGGDYQKSYRIPAHANPITPNGYFVIAKKRDGAFADIADVFIEDLDIGRRNIYIELRDFDNRLMESAGNTEQQAFCGGYDLVTARSMERVQVLFGNRGEASRNWHTYSDDVGFPTINEGWRLNTLASPGAANSPDYSGSTTSGTFE
ncbi:MAG: hypothetical protein H0U74_22000 [Bradymonadaceae bacterium]|nr:hypothetical protein [Lujinxingiaceae bacterium]